jgi:hypothetical protein
MNELIIIDVLTMAEKKIITSRASSAIQQTSQETLCRVTIRKYQVTCGKRLLGGLFFSL